MRNTLNINTHHITYINHQKHNIPHLSISNKINIILLLLCYHFIIAQSKQTTIFKQFQNKNDKISLRLLSQTHSYIQFQRFISSQPYNCKIILKNQYTKNIPENLTKINIDLTYGHVMSLNSKQQLPTYTKQQIDEIKHIDKILDLLNGQCLYYETVQFIYEYCHKQHIRQFDNVQTKTYNAKAQYEDISMGLYNPDFYNNRRIRRGYRELTPEQRKVNVPQYSDFSNQHKHLTIEDIADKDDEIEGQQSDDGNLVHLNSPLAFSDEYYLRQPLIVEMVCQSTQNNTMRQYLNKGLIVHPYTIAFTKKNGPCDKLDYYKISTPGKYFQDQNQKPLRVFKNFLYGNVEQICTVNWGWQKIKGNYDFDNFLVPGSLLFIELYNERDERTEFHYVTVKKVHNSDLVELDAPLGRSFKIQNGPSSFLDAQTVRTRNFIKNITKCQLMFQKQADFDNTFSLEYLRKGLVIINSTNQIKKGDNFGCICKSFIQNDFKLIDIDFTVQKHLWQTYYQTYVKTNTFIIKTHLYAGRQYTLQECYDYACFKFKQNNSSHIISQNNKKFTQVRKLTKYASNYIIDNTNIEKFYIVTIKNNGIIKLQTKGENGIIYTYLLTQGQIIKIAEFANGTKEIIKQNKYYQNSTKPSSQLSSNFIYIKISRLPNGTYYGGIWKIKDYLYFPRFTLFGQQLISFDRKSGYAYIRSLDLNKIQRRDSMAIVKYLKKLEQIYLMKEKVKEAQSNMFLNKSYAIRYEYVSGKYCDVPVNRYRSTTVQLTCGKSWFSITKLLQKNPCQYWINIQTTLLCRQGYKQVVEQDEQILNSGNSNIIQNGMVCHYQYGIQNEAHPYFYIQQALQQSQQQ